MAVKKQNKNKTWKGSKAYHIMHRPFWIKMYAYKRNRLAVVYRRWIYWCIYTLLTLRLIFQKMISTQLNMLVIYRRH